MKTENPFKYSNSNKRYHTLDYYYKNKYNSKVFKVSLNLGLTCPNIDGTKGYKGCIYCKNGSEAFDLKKETLKKQFEDVKTIMHKKWKNAKYIAYFQSNSNTYTTIEFMKKCYEEVLTYDGVVGINIATRCDCITEECLKYLIDLNTRTDLVVELGVQTINEKTMKFLNLCYTVKDFETMYNKLKNNNIKVVVHIINGLPYETKHDMINTIKFLNRLKVYGIKIHMLHVLKDTTLSNIYINKPFKILTKEEYIDIVCDQLELLNKNIVINRLTGDPKTNDLIEPKWLVKKFCVLNDIDKEMSKRNSYQGINETI